MTKIPRTGRRISMLTGNPDNAVSLDGVKKLVQYLDDFANEAA